MRGCHRGDHSQVRSGDLGESLDLARTIGSKLHHRHLVFFFRRRSVRGKPTRLLKLPSVFKTLPRSDFLSKNASSRIAATISLVVVLPLDPVMANTFGAIISRR